MIWKKSTKLRIDRAITILGVVLTIGAVIYLAISGRHYFNSRSLRDTEIGIKSFGIWAPVMIFGSIFISTVIPPLPIPISLIEIASGLTMGLFPGVILVWTSQIISSVAAYWMTRMWGNKFGNRITKNKWLDFYRNLLVNKGALGVFIVRATMICPFNVSFLAGLMKIEGWSFGAATALGVIPEVVFFVSIGVLLSHRIQIRLWYVFIFVVLISTIPGLILTVFNWRKERPKRPVV